jgi:hypothetical protein
VVFGVGLVGAELFGEGALFDGVPPLSHVFGKLVSRTLRAGREELVQYCFKVIKMVTAGIRSASYETTPLSPLAGERPGERG